MRKPGRALAVMLALLFVSACNQDPNFVKQQYVQSGNKYYERGRYREAMIMYRKAVAKDQKYGMAYYRIALTALKMGQVASATGPLRRAIELLPHDSPEWSDASLKLAGIVLHVAQDIDVPGKNKPMIDEVEQIRHNLLARNPNSFAGIKLTGDLLLLQSVDYFRRGDKQESKDAINQAVASYRRAIALDASDLPVRIALARTLSLQQNYPEAEQIYRYVISKDKHSSAAQSELYRLLVTAGKPAEAEQALKDASAANPRDHGYELLLAAHYYALKDQVSMKRVLDRLESEFKEYPNAYFTAGDFYLRIGDSNAAVQQYEAGIQHDPANKTAYQKRLIETLIRQGKTREAFEKDLDLLKENPKDPEARGMKASFLLDKGDVNQAIVDLQQVVTAKPDNFVARYNLGRAHFAKGEFEQASQQFSEAIKLRPDYLRARLGLAQVALMQGAYERALKASLEAQQFSPASQAAKLLEAAALMRLQRFPEARTKLETLLKADPRQPEVLLEMGVLDISEKRYPEAAQLFHTAFEVNPGNVKGLMGEAEAYYLQQQPQKAIQLLEGAAAKYPNRADIQRELAGAHLRVNDQTDAFRELQALVARYQNSPREQAEAYATIGQLYNRQGKPREALDVLGKARQLSPDNVGILNYYAQCLDRAGQREEAKKVYREALAKDPGNPETLNNLAFLLADLGTDLDQALTLANRAKQRMPNMVEVSDTIGFIYLKKNLSDSATDAFRELNAKVPNNPTFHLHYCMALEQKGDHAGAAKECRTAMGLKPPPEDQAQLKELLAKLG